MYEDDWKVYDHKELSNSILHKQEVAKLKIRSSRVWVIHPRNRPKEVSITSISMSYSENCTTANVVQENVNISGRKPKLLPSRSHVSAAKKTDILKLLPFVSLTPNERKFYDDELKKVPIAKLAKKTSLAKKTAPSAKKTTPSAKMAILAKNKATLKKKNG